MKSNLSLGEVIHLLSETRHKSIVERMEVIGLDPRSDFRGRDWRWCSFRNASVAGADFRNARLWEADFTNADVAGADFRGAGDIDTTNFHHARNWESALLDKEQRGRLAIKIEAERVSKSRPSRAQQLSDFIHQIRAAPNLRTAKGLLAQMEEARMPPDRYAYTMVMELGWGRDVQLLFEDFLARGGTPDVAIYTALLRSASHETRARTIMSDMRRNGIEPDDFFYNRFISRVRNIDVGLEILREMIAKGERVSEYTTYALFDCAELFKEAVRALVESYRAGVNVFTREMIEELTSRTPMPERTKAFVVRSLEEMQPPRAIIYGIISRGFAGRYRSWGDTALRQLGLMRHRPKRDR